jgi:hypothetical protein
VEERASLTRREQLHLGALDAWSSGDLGAAAARWDVLLTEFPRDLLALRVSQFVLSYLGESVRMRDTVARVLPAWSPSVSGYGFVLGCHAYALEEAGDYPAAEAAGLEAVALNRADIWAAHAVAHVREMEGRLGEGVEWIAELAPLWVDCTNFSLHLRWHEGLFRLEMDQFDQVLEGYDRDIRPGAADQYLDVANAASLLWRLEQAGVDVGSRWTEVAQRSKRHVGDHALVFADLHYLMALAGAGETATIARFMESCADFAEHGAGTEASVMKEVGLPLANAVLAHHRQAYGEVVDLVAPIRLQIRRIGGSHAQRDVFDQLLIDASLRARRLDVAVPLLAERTTRRPRNRWGWRHYAAALDAAGQPAAATAHRTLERLRGE